MADRYTNTDFTDSVSRARMHVSAAARSIYLGHAEIFCRDCGKEERRCRKNMKQNNLTNAQSVAQSLMRKNNSKSI